MQHRNCRRQQKIQIIYNCICAVDLHASNEKTAYPNLSETMPNFSKDKNHLLAPSNACGFLIAS